MISDTIYSDWMAKTQRKKIEQILKEVEPKGKVIDVGCGPGFLEEKVNTVAVDVNKEYLKVFEGLKAVASGDFLPFRNEAFNTVFCLDTIHKLKDNKELIRILKVNGQLIVSKHCSRYNWNREINWLKNLFVGMKIEKEFLAKAPAEWDAVIVLRKFES